MKKTKFIPGKTYIPPSGKVFDNEEIDNAIEAAKDAWWTEGRFSKKFEKEFSQFLGTEYVSLVNSGSSANLVAFASLTSEVFGKRQLQPGDEVITTNVAFPTTVNPILIYQLVPVFIDAQCTTFNIDASKIEKAITQKTKAIMVAHTLGKPFNLDIITKIAKKYNLWLIEDCCDALGSQYGDKKLGTFGDVATFSFYPAHQITMGEGGAVVTNNPLIHRSVRQFRDWGRDCWCDTGKDNTCGKRFDQQHGELPYGYDHKYVYSHIGYNLKLTDFQAAIGLAQLKKLPQFIQKRRNNYQKLYSFFSQYLNYFQLLETDEKEKPCWFGFPLIVKQDAPFTRTEFAQDLEKQKIGTRNIFSGNLLRHPAYLKKKNQYRVVGKTPNADIIMNQGLWFGVYPGIDTQRIEYMQHIITQFVSQYGKK